MADFKFNFNCNKDHDEDGKNECFSTDIPLDSKNEKDNHYGPDARELTWISSQQRNFQLQKDKCNLVSHTFGSETLTTVATSAVEDFLLTREKEGSGVVRALSEHSDLVAGEYEGGLKVWECSLDLCRYLQEGGVGVKGSRVLELGCGAGLPGILAAKTGAAIVHFQDFNQEVVELCTMVNVELNAVDPSTCAFFDGDWASFSALAHSRNILYDLILTSETIYNPSSYDKLLKVFILLLSDTGVILVAAKNDYFGVGGSVFSFSQYVSQRHFSVTEDKHIDTGVPRKILRLTRKS